MRANVELYFSHATCDWRRSHAQVLQAREQTSSTGGIRYTMAKVVSQKINLT